MKDAAFIEKMIVKGKAAGDKVKAQFPAVTLQQLNWKPVPESWSIGQCIDHLIVADCLYFPAFKKIAERKYRMTAWQKWSPFGVLFGKILVNQLQENVRRKVKTAKVFFPSASDIDAGIWERFQKHLDTLLEYIETFKDIDLDKMHITSPVSNFITYSLRDAVTILIYHEHRHINQAIRVKTKEDFPMVNNFINKLQ